MSSPKQPEPSSLMGISFDDSPQPISGVRCESERTQEDPTRLPGGVESPLEAVLAWLKSLNTAETEDEDKARAT